MDEEATKRPAEGLDALSGFSSEAILDQLQRILAHPEFRATDRMRSFLRFVVEETLAGRADRLKGYTVATEVFGRDEDFDAANDPIVSIQAGRLRRALERYYLVAGGGDPVHIHIPKGRYHPHFAANVVERGAPSMRPGASASEVEDSHSPVGPSVAVLPLENLTGDPNQVFFTAGLTEELVTELGRFQDLVVYSCQQTVRKPEMPVSPADLAAGAEFVLGGSLRRDPDTVKVSVHLSDTKTGRQIWSDAFKHPVEASRLIATQEEIARRVVAAVGGEYGIIARRLSAQARNKPPAQLSTYEAMLRFYVHQLTAEPDSAAQCLPLLQQAVQQEPDYGPAWSALAALHGQAFMFDVSGIDQPLDTALRFARRGVTLEPGSQLAHLILGSASYLNDDPAASLEAIDTALALNPNSLYAAASAGFYLVQQGMLERGLPLLQRAVSGNPYHPSWVHAGLFFAHFQRRDYESALWELEYHGPSQGFWTPVRFAATLGKLGRIDDAAPHIRQLWRLKPDFGARGRELLHRLVKVDALIDELMDGMRAAGFEFEG